MFFDKISLLLQVVLVIVAVVIFSFFDPFGWMASRKKKLEDTPITVSSIREIGQLVSAEYYGEVMASLTETITETIKKQEDTYRTEVQGLQTRYLVALQKLNDNKDSINLGWIGKRRQIEDYFYEANPQLVAHPRFQYLVNITLEVGNARAEALRRTAKPFQDERHFLQYIFRNGVTSDIQEVFTDNTRWAAAFGRQVKDRLEDATSQKSYTRNQLVVIGRGWVKAGFDFGSFREDNFRYNSDENIVYLLGLKATVLDYDINPWFIPEKNIKGFEIIATSHTSRNPKYLDQVKATCLNKLRDQAVDRGILVKADEYARESLKSFFSLLLNKPIANVVILEKPLDDFDFPVVNGMLARKSLSLIDRDILALAKIDKSRARWAVEKLKRAEVSYGDSVNVHVNRFLARYDSIAFDGDISFAEWQKLVSPEPKQWSRLDSLWFFPFSDFGIVKDSIRQQALTRTGYNKKTAGRLFIDSLAMNEDWKKYEADFNKSLSDAVRNHMTTQWKAARKESLKVFKNGIKSVHWKEDMPADSIDKVTAGLARLEKSL